jgi:DNA-binding PadR family transcriptional regulator
MRNIHEESQGHVHGHGRRMRGFGFPPGFPFGGGGPGGADFGPFGGRGGRRRGSRGRPNVRAAVLALLLERPMHGYEIIQELAERSAGVWRPSPGSVYPTLQMLEEEGLVSGEESGGKKLFSLTESGRAEAESGPDAPWEEAGQGEHWQVVREFGQAEGAVRDALRQVVVTGTPEQRAKALAVLADARKRIYLILAEEG